MWFRVNGLLPDGLQKSLPDRPPEMHQADMHEGVPKPLNKTVPAPRRSPPPPPTTAESASRTSGGGGQLGAFWTTQHGKDSFGVEDTARPKFDEEPTNQSSSKQERNRSERVTLHKEEPRLSQKTVHGKSVNRSDDGPSKDFEINFFHDGSNHVTERPIALRSDNAPAFQSDAFNAFATEFGTNKLSPGRSSIRSGKEELLEAEVERLKEQLKQTNVEKTEITSKYEKLSAICRSQRQEIQELKQALASRTPSPNRDASKTSKTQPSSGVQQSSPNPLQKKVEGTVWELQQGLFDKSSPSAHSNSWQAFPEDPMAAMTTMNNTRKSVRTRNGHQNKQAADQVTPSWGFGTDSFTAVPTSSPQLGTVPSELNYSQRFGEPKNIESKSASQPAGWAGF